MVVVWVEEKERMKVSLVRLGHQEMSREQIVVGRLWVRNPTASSPT